MDPERDDDLRLTWLGHSTVVVDLAGQRILTDPLLLRHNGALRRRGPAPRPEQWAGADAVLLSHLHHDHAELRSLRRVHGTVVFTSERNSWWLRRRGLVARPAADWTSVGAAEVRLVEAVHTSRPMPHRPNDANGHLVRARTTTVWAAGDTSLYPDMARLPELAGVDRLDVALVPIGGWGPRLSGGHMDPAQAAVACALTKARWALPVHWGTLHAPLVNRFGTWFERPLAAFEAHLGTTAPDCRLIRLPLGETWSRPADGSG